MLCQRLLPPCQLYGSGLVLFLLNRMCLDLQKPFSADPLALLATPACLLSGSLGTQLMQERAWHVCVCEQAPTGYMPTLHTPAYHSLWHFISRHAYRMCVILMGFCFSETLKCCQAVMYTKGNKLCSPCSAVLDIAAGTWSIRSKGFVSATLRSSSSDGWETAASLCRQCPLAKQSCSVPWPWRYLWERNFVTQPGISKREVFCY